MPTTTRDKDKWLFSGATAQAFREEYAEVYEEMGPEGPFDQEAVYESLKKPKDPQMGRFALPVFPFLRFLKRKPDEVTANVAVRINASLAATPDSAHISCEGVGGYLNARIDSQRLIGRAIAQILSAGAEYGASSLGKGNTIIVEYSSPNIAKPFGIGHLRTTVIGNSLRLIMAKHGYDVVGINYPGDWGTQFGKMIVAYRKWGDSGTVEGEAVRKLLDLYVRFHKEAEMDDSLNDEARLAFKNLEAGREEEHALWERFKEISLAEFQRVYDNLGVSFDLTVGESFFNDKMDAVIERLEKAGLTRVSDGALIVDLDDENLPPALLRKEDGATLYITRDLANALWRWEKYHFSECLYVVGAAQADHFRQIVRVLRKLEQAEGTEPESVVSSRIKHVEFGWVRFAGKTMATRQGNIVFLDDVIAEAVSLAKEKILEKNPGLKEIERTAHQIGTGAVAFNQLSARRQRDIDFNWSEVLNFEGETGPYLQYTHARLCSLLRKYGKPVDGETDIAPLDSVEELRVAEILADFPQTLVEAAQACEPFFVTNYLLRLASAYNKVYQRKDEQGRMVKILSEDQAEAAARMALVKAVQTVLGEGLRLLGIAAPEEM
jgi:arginyl-tRNA synthetase